MSEEISGEKMGGLRSQLLHRLWQTRSGPSLQVMIESTTVLKGYQIGQPN